MPTITFSKSNKTVECAATQTVLEAAQSAGLDIPFNCQGGTCHTCAVKGEGPMETEEMLALTPDEMAQGWRLTCVAKPLGDCIFDA